MERIFGQISEIHSRGNALHQLRRARTRGNYDFKVRGITETMITRGELDFTREITSTTIIMYSHYELEGYEIEWSVLKKCHFDRVTSV